MRSCQKPLYRKKLGKIDGWRVTACRAAALDTGRIAQVSWYSCGEQGRLGVLRLHCINGTPALIHAVAWIAARRVWPAWLIAICSPLALAQPSITDLNVLSGGSPTYSYTTGISADGNVVTGYSSSAAGQRAFRWTAAGGMQNLGVLSGFSLRSSGQALSADGSVIAGVSTGANNTARAFRWTAATGMQSIGVLGTGSASYARAISADGSIIAGGSYTSGFNGATAVRWTAATGMQTLNGMPSNAASITSNGQIIAGTFSDAEAFSRAFRWTSAAGMQDLGILPDADSAEANALSADGAIAVGYSGDQFNLTFNHAFRWTAAGGMQDLGTLNGSDFSVANAVSADGAVVVGSSNLPSGDRAFIWTAGLGMVDLETYLVGLGVDMTGWVMNSATGISADGSAITGYGSFNGQDRAFLLRGVPTCGTGVLGDGDANGSIDGLDIQGMINAVLIAGGSGGGASCTYDLNHDGQVDATDVELFIGVLLTSG